MSHMLRIFVYILSAVALLSFHQSLAVIKNHVSSLRNCDVCGIQFRKIAEWERHMAGKRHAEMILRSTNPTELWDEFVHGVPLHWQDGINVTDIVPAWKDEELSTLDFRYRSTCLHPTPVFGNLKTYTRARVWRYIRDALGLGYYSELAAVMVAADSDQDGHVRVKELFESIESYKVIANFIIAAQRTAAQNNYPPIERIVEVACGHGLVGILLAYRFRRLQVHLYDLEQRPTYEAFLRAFESKGIKLFPDLDEKVLPNIHFYEEDLRNSKPFIPNSIVVCLHGCGEVNEIAIEMARDEKASGWVVMPCCILKDQYLDGCNVDLSHDNTRYSMLCGALANRYNAQRIAAIDTRITNRPIIIAGGVGHSTSGLMWNKLTNSLTDIDSTIAVDLSEEDYVANSLEDKEKARLISLAASVKRGKMPRLLLD
jgi:SAM-dependent methyltransferase